MSRRASPPGAGLGGRPGPAPRCSSQRSAAPEGAGQAGGDGCPVALEGHGLTIGWGRVSACASLLPLETSVHASHRVERPEPCGEERGDGQPCQQVLEGQTWWLSGRAAKCQQGAAGRRDQFQLQGSGWVHLAAGAAACWGGLARRGCCKGRFLWGG